MAWIAYSAPADKKTTAQGAWTKVGHKKLLSMQTKHTADAGMTIVAGEKMESKKRANAHVVTML